MKTNWMKYLILSTALMLISYASTGITASTEIDREVDVALAQLYEATPEAKYLAQRAKGILVFPHVIKAGFIAGAQYGKGAMRQRGRTTGYYSVVAASYGLQAGAQMFGYALFFMNDAALADLDSSAGFEVGVGPSVVLVDEGMAKTLTTRTLQEDVYAFTFGQQGLMAGMGLQGSKISRITP